MTSLCVSRWNFARLFPLRDPRATANAAIVGPMTLGIEVTEPDLATQCGLGNIDPQHTGGNHALSAIEAACDWPLPPTGTTLATIRPDADALGAMAVLVLRAWGQVITVELAARIGEIGRWDRMDQGCWKDWRKAHPPLFRPARAVDLGGKPLELQAIDALVRMEGMALEARVLALAEWLAGQAPPPREAIAAALAHEARLLKAWNGGEIELSLHVSGKIALLRADGPSRLDLAYRLAPVVVAETTLPAGRKFTVAQFDGGRIDLAGLLADLAPRESGWGGSATLIGSPQGKASRLTLEDLAGLAAARLTPG